MTEIIIHSLIHTLEDTLKTLPVLFLVYLLIEWIEHRFDFSKLMNPKASFLGPFFGALTGLVPQCGFSAASASLFGEKMISASTLIAVFIATSDEAVPILLADGNTVKTVPLLILIKLVIAIIAGYVLRYTLFKESIPSPEHHCHCLPSNDEHHHEEGHHDNHENPDCHCCCDNKSLLLSALLHTLKVTAFLFVTMILITLTVNFIGKANLEIFLLSGSFLQPFLPALIGLIPGCAGSVLLTELYISSSISFASLISGLSAGCGFGYLILFKETKDKKKAFSILLTTYLISVAAGIIITLIP